MRAAAAGALITAPAAAQRLARPSGGQQLQEQTAADVPRCARKLGALSTVDGDDPRPWTQYSLAPPSKLLKVLVRRSGCFNLVDRGSGLQAARLERDVGADLGLQRRSNVGQGQIKAADYVLVAEIQGANSNVSGGGGAAGIGGLVGGRFGGLIGGFGSKKMEANTILSVTNVRMSETIATEEGYAAKKNLTFGAGGGDARRGRGVRQAGPHAHARRGGVPDGREERAVVAGGGRERRRRLGAQYPARAVSVASGGGRSGGAQARDARSIASSALR